MTWPQWGKKQNGALYQQDNLVHPIPKKEFLSLPTPCKSDADKMGNNSLIRLIETGNRYAPSHKRYKPNLNNSTASITKNNLQKIKTTGKDFQLNPHFVTEIMGFPID